MIIQSQDLTWKPEFGRRETTSHLNMEYLSTYWTDSTMWPLLRHVLFFPLLNDFGMHGIVHAIMLTTAIILKEENETPVNEAAYQFIFRREKYFLTLIKNPLFTEMIGRLENATCTYTWGEALYLAAVMVDQTKKDETVLDVDKYIPASRYRNRFCSASGLFGHTMFTKQFEMYFAYYHTNKGMSIKAALEYSIYKVQYNKSCNVPTYDEVYKYWKTRDILLLPCLMDPRFVSEYNVAQHEACWTPDKTITIAAMRVHEQEDMRHFVRNA